MGRLTMLAALRDTLVKAPVLITADLTGQTVVVVGANTGIGFEAAKHFAEMKPGKLILGCRSEEKGRAAVERIKAETGFEDVELRLIDLAKFATVISFADSFKDEERLDVLVMNAAVARRTIQEVTEDGWEECLQVNNLSTSLAALLLVPKLSSTAKAYGVKPRVVIVTSDLHYWATLDEAKFDAESSFKAISDDHRPAKLESRYSDTKLLNVFFARSLASLLSRTPILVACANPGYCKSDLRRHITGLLSLISRIMDALVGRTSEEGSRQLIWAALGDIEGNDAEIVEQEGAYVNMSKVEEPSDYVLGEGGKKRGDKLWADLVRELSKVDGRVPDIVRQYS